MAVIFFKRYVTVFMLSDSRLSLANWGLNNRHPENTKVLRGDGRVGSYRWLRSMDQTGPGLSLEGLRDLKEARGVLLAKKEAL